MAATKTAIYRKLDDPVRLTFWTHRKMAQQLKANAKLEALSLPDYLSFLMQRGLTANGKKGRRSEP